MSGVRSGAGDAPAAAREGPFGRDVSIVHHRSNAAHAAACAPGIIDRLTDVRARGGLVLELGCGSGLLAKEMIAAGLRVVATDASPAMVELAGEFIGDGAQDVRVLRLPEDPLPAADAIVAVGHPLNYVESVREFNLAFVAIARALRPGGVSAFDVCDLEWGEARVGAPPLGRAGPDWAIITEFSLPAPDRFVRDITTFLPDDAGGWRRGEERHDTILVDTAQIPALLARHGIDARITSAFGEEQLPIGLRVVIGRRRL